MTDVENQENNEVSTPAPRVMRMCTKIILSVISGLFLIIFLYSAVLQHNDNDGVFVWMIFYYFNALLALLSIAFYWGLFKSPNIETGLFGLASGVVIWGLVLSIVAGIAFGNASASDAGGDAQDFNDKEEKGFEMGGAILGLVGAIYHTLAIKYGASC